MDNLQAPPPNPLSAGVAGNRMHKVVLQTMDEVQGRVLLSQEAGWEERPGLEHPGGQFSGSSLRKLTEALWEM